MNKKIKHCWHCAKPRLNTDRLRRRRVCNPCAKKLVG